MKRIAIIGLGLMGGSLGLAVKARGLPFHVAGCTRSPERGQTALKRQAIDSLHPAPKDAVRGAELVIYCAPILSIPGLIKASLEGLKQDCILTDVGSTKAYLVREIAALLEGNLHAAFVGSHPIAGSEQQGIESARADLFDGATVVVTPDRSSSAGDLQAVGDFWRKLGGSVYEMDAEHPDQLVAMTSHLPHLIASLLVTTVGRSQDTGRLAAFCGSGFRDTTRVAEGSPEVWRDIVQTNTDRVADELRAFRDQLNQLMVKLETRDFDGITRFLEKGSELRKALVSAGAARDKAGES